MPWRGETEPGTTAVDPWWRARLRVAPESDGPWAVAVRAGWVVPGPTRAAWQGLRVWHGSWGSATLGRARDAVRDEGPAPCKGGQPLRLPLACLRSQWRL